MLILIVAGGPDKGQIHELFDDKEFTLGRDGADLQFTDPKISRLHARMWAKGGRWYIEDLGSRHGTHRNHNPISDLQPLKDGDYIQLGKTVMVLARMSAVNFERAALTMPSVTPAPLSSGLPVKPKYLIAVTAAAAAILIGLNVTSLVTANRGVDQLEQRIVALGDETPEQQRLRGEVRLALEAKKQHEQKLETMMAAFGSRQDLALPKLDTILATIHSQPDVVGPLTALAQAIESRDTGPQLNAKIDSALALLQERGGDAEALAAEFRAMLAEQPTVEQIAAATRKNNDRTVAVLSSILTKLDGSPSAATSSSVAAVDQSALTQELADLRRLIEARSTADQATGQLKPLLEKVLARVESLEPNNDTQTLLAAIAEVKTALPPDNSAALSAMLARFEDQPTTLDLANVNRQLASLASELRDRKDAQLIQKQLAQLIETSRGQADVEAALAATSDPLLGQILSQVQALAENDKKLDAIYASLEKQPYENRAMLSEVIAQAGNDATEQMVSAMLDRAMAELRGKSITDADQLRRLIQREVVAGVGKANGVRIQEDADSRLTRTETAYKLAFESGKTVVIGVTQDASTGGYTKGRTLDPVAAKAAGHRSWRDWYLMDDLANRMQIEQDATRVARGQRLNATETIRVPETTNSAMPVSPDQEDSRD